ncbi:Biotin-lipoyl like [Lachnospiraceae bacterium G11]|nr:Biotin-lipoyl like [Lachnospiraceae bacterium G11]
MSNEGKKNIFARFFGAIWRWIKRHKVLTVILVLLIALIIYVVNVVNKAKELLNNNSFDFATVETKDLTNSVSATGKIVGLDKKNAQAGITGVEFTEINVEVGDYVEAGQVIAILDSSDIQENIDIAKKQLNASEANNSIGVNGAARTLNNAEVNRDKDAEKADIAIGRSWDSYAEASGKLEDVEKKYNDAVNSRKNAENGVNAANNAYNTAQAEIGRLQGLDYNTEFSTKINEIKAVLADAETNDGDTIDTALQSAFESSTLDTFDASLFSAATFGVSDADKIASVDAVLAAMSQIQTDKTNNETRLAELQAGITQLANNVAVANSNLAQASAVEDTMKSSWEGAKSSANSLWNAYNDSVRSKDDIKRADDATVATAADSFNTTRNTASVSNLPSKQNIENLEEQLDKCTVTAPMSGTVTAVNFKKGDKYDGVTPIIVVEDESAYQVSAEIDEYDISKIEIGQKVQIRTNGTGDLELEGKVVSIAPHATALPASMGAAASSANVTYNILIDILTPNNDLKMDMTAKIVIITDSKEKCKCIPIDAFQEEEESGRFYVEIYDPTDPTKMSVTEDGKIEYEKLYVEKGMESDYYAEVISNELTEGTQVVIPSEYDNSLYDLTMEFN